MGRAWMTCTVVALAALASSLIACGSDENDDIERATDRRACLKASPRRCSVRERPSPRNENIVSGQPAEPGEWPWMARLDIQIRPAPGGKPEWYECGGSLIAPTVVLTAAHCVTDSEGRLAIAGRGAWVTLGRHVLNQRDVGESIKVSRSIVHQRYEARSKDNDVALLRLSRASAQTPAVLGTEQDWGFFARAMGWGKTATEQPSSNVLFAVDLPLRQDVSCSPTFRNFEPGLMLCAGGDGRDTCFGDSGGPLMIRGGPTGWKQIGVTSYGIDRCGAAGIPAVYAWVAGFELRAWIDERI